MNKTRNITLLGSLLFVGFSLYFLSRLDNKSTQVNGYNYQDSTKTNLVKNAKYFDLFVDGGDVEIVVRGRDLRERKRVLFKETKGRGRRQSKVVCLSSVYVGYLESIGLDVNIVGVDDLGNISNSKIRSNPDVLELGHNTQVNKELLLSLQPDLILLDDFNIDQEVIENLELDGALVIPCNSFREENPLARAEWVKFFGALFDFVEESVAVYEGIESRYLELSRLTADVTNRPTVFLNSMWGDQWTIPGSKSFQAYLLEAAGADYLKNDDSSSITIHVGMEYMISNASSLQFWLNSGSFTSLSSLVESNENYAQFKAVKEKNVFNNNKGVNSEGGIPFWETSGVQPDVVLSDMIHIFHPELLPNHTLKYYQRLK